MEVDIQRLGSIMKDNKIEHLKNIMKIRVKQYSLIQKDLTYISKRQILALAKRLNLREIQYECENEDTSERWLWKEHLLFLWVVIYYAQTQQIEAHTMGQEQFKNIRILFPLKNITFLRYEYILAFCSDNYHHNHWENQQTDLLQKIIRSNCSKKWKSLSYQLFKHSFGSYFKNAQSCRNKWENHINPILNKRSWSLQQDLKMIDLIMQHGTKWSFLARTLRIGRTEHMIKNRFRSHIKRFDLDQQNDPFEQICITIKKKVIEMNKQASVCQNTNESQQILDFQLAKQPLISEGSQIQSLCSIFSTKQSGEAKQRQRNKLKSVDEIMGEWNLTLYGQNYRYSNLLNNAWIEDIMEEGPNLGQIEWI